MMCVYLRNSYTLGVSDHLLGGLLKNVLPSVVATMSARNHEVTHIYYVLFRSQGQHVSYW